MSFEHRRPFRDPNPEPYDGGPTNVTTVTPLADHPAYSDSAKGIVIRVDDSDHTVITLDTGTVGRVTIGVSTYLEDATADLDLFTVGVLVEQLRKLTGADVAAPITGTV